MPEKKIPASPPETCERQDCVSRNDVVLTPPNPVQAVERLSRLAAFATNGGVPRLAT